MKSRTELRIYKRKQERKKKERKHALDKEHDQEKKKVFSFFLVAFLFESVFSFSFFGRFLGRKRVFFYKFPPQVELKGICMLLCYMCPENPERWRPRPICRVQLANCGVVFLMINHVRLYVCWLARRSVGLSERQVS